jgi:hypothetical protein
MPGGHKASLVRKTVLRYPLSSPFQGAVVTENVSIGCRDKRKFFPSSVAASLFIPILLVASFKMKEKKRKKTNVHVNI